MRITILIICLALLGSSLNLESTTRKVLNLLESKPLKDQFKLWHFLTERPYDINTEEGLNRYRIFRSNLKYIKETNEKNLGFTVGLGPFTDLTEEEFRSTYLNELKVNTPFIKTQSIRFTESEDYSYLFKNVNTQKCNDSYAFVVADLIEAMGKLEKVFSTISISSQIIIDCDKKSDGCKGGSIANALEFVKKHGTTSSQEYSYEVENHNYQQNCRLNKLNWSSNINYNHLEACGSSSQPCTEDLINSFISKGPYGTYIKTDKNFIHYASGKWISASSDNKAVNHAVVVVQKTNLTIKFRNHFGPYWGINGYGLIQLKGNTLGVNSYGYSIGKIHMWTPFNN